MKKMLIFVQSSVGGAERVSVTIGKKMDPRIYDVCFYAVGPWECRIKDFIPLDKFKGHLQISNPFKLLVSLYKVLRSESPDIIFSSTMYINTKLLLLQPFFSKVRFVVRSENNFFTFNLRQRCMVRALYGRAKRVVAQTNEMRMELIDCAGLRKNKVVTIQNPQDFDAISIMTKEPSPFKNCQKRYFVASGRFTPAKGFDVLIRAFSRVVQKMECAELYIVGRNSGPNEAYYTQIKDEIKSLGISEKVHCVGHQINPYKYVKNADCFVLSSRNEGLPNVLIEALFLGTPVAATMCIPAIGRIVENGKTGFLAEPENDTALADAMLKAVNLGRIHSEYPLDTIPQFEKLFQAILNE